MPTLFLPKDLLQIPISHRAAIFSFKIHLGPHSALAKFHFFQPTLHTISNPSVDLKCEKLSFISGHFPATRYETLRDNYPAEPRSARSRDIALPLEFGSFQRIFVDSQ